MDSLESAISGALAPLRAREPGGFKRLDDFLPILAGKKKPPRITTGQEYGKPSRLYFPGLEAKPWHDPKNHPELAKLEKSFEHIRAEALALKETDMDPPGGDREGRGLSYSGWSTYTFHELDPYLPTEPGVAQRFIRKEYAGHYAACPKTGAAARKAGLPGQFLFSFLKGGGRVAPHCSEANFVLTAHMGLSVPPGCWLEVAGERRSWREGKFFVFDDTFEHSAENPGSQTRGILWCFVWHPGLSPLEREALSAVFNCLTLRRTL